MYNWSINSQKPLFLSDSLFYHDRILSSQSSNANRKSTHIF